MDYSLLLSMLLSLPLFCISLLFGLGRLEARLKERFDWVILAVAAVLAVFTFARCSWPFQPEKKTPPLRAAQMGAGQLSRSGENGADGPCGPAPGFRSDELQLS